MPKSMIHAVALLIAFVASCGVARADAPKMDKLTPAGKFTGPLELGLPGIIGVVLPEKYITDAPTQAGSIRVITGTLDPKTIKNHVISWKLADEAKIRVPRRVQYDKFGRPVKQEPLDRKDPDRKLGGVQGDVSELRSGDIVTVTVARTGKGEYVATVIQVIARNEPSGPLRALHGNFLKKP